MENEIKLAVGAVVALGVATAALVVMPYIQVRDIKAPVALKPYTDQQERGRAVPRATAEVDPQRPLTAALRRPATENW